MNISKFLGKVTGIYFLIISISMLLHMDQFITHVNNLMGNASLMFVTGFFTLILGILLVVSHNIWEGSWRLIITIIGWVTLLKGVTIFLYPQFIDNITISFTQNTHIAYASAIIELLLSLLLLYFGFKHPSSSEKRKT